jgi:hypothetical protein
MAHIKATAVAVLAIAITLLVACGASSPAKRSGGKQNGSPIGRISTNSTKKRVVGGALTMVKQAPSPTVLLDTWATCERRHGNPGQAVPTINAHWVIQITARRLEAVGPVAGARHALVARDACSRYLAAAQHALRAAHPSLRGPDRAEYLTYVACMRANGVPDYPSPEPTDPTATNFIGSGVNPDSPSVKRVNELCGKRLHLPTWWIAGWGPPGDITVHSAGLPRRSRNCLFEKHFQRSSCPAGLIPVPAY